MPHITLDMIRRKAEHNEGLVHTLEELTLHQEEIEQIDEVLGSTCRRLKILYLQNNIIGKMENLHHLKELEYLNLALNNIAAIEGVGSCECLRKLDLTVNFVDLDALESSITNLVPRHHLRELYMMGNPCQANWEGFSSYVTGRLPQLELLDGKEITRSMKIIAQQQLPALQAELNVLAEEVRQRKAAKAAEAMAKTSESNANKGKDSLPEGVVTEAEFAAASEDGASKAEEKTQHTPEVRTEIYMELSEQKREKEKREKENLPRERNYKVEHEEAIAKAREREAEGIIRQCNESKLDFSVDEDSKPGFVILDVGVPKYLDSSLIDVDVHPHYLSIVIKGKVLRLQLPVEVKAGETKAQRSKVTGSLQLTMPKVNHKESIGIMPSRNSSAYAKRVAADAARESSGKAPPRTVRNSGDQSIGSLMLSAAGAQPTQTSKAVSIRGIVKGGPKEDPLDHITAPPVFTASLVQELD